MWPCIRQFAPRSSWLKIVAKFNRTSPPPQLAPSPSPFIMGAVSPPFGPAQEASGMQAKSASLDSVPPNSDAVASGEPDSEKYVDKLLRNVEPSPSISWSNWYKEVRWFNLSVIVVTPLVASYGAVTTHLDWRTFCFCLFYYLFNMIGGYFWSASPG